MSDLRVPMLSVTAELTCADGRSFTGEVFLPATSSRHTGPMRVEEWLDEPTAFFAFLDGAGGAPFIMNKRDVLILTVPREADGSPEVEEGLPLRRVTVECGGKQLGGELLIDMPSHLSRVLDFLNSPQAFISLHDGAQHHVIQKKRITRVLELRDDRPAEGAGA